MALATRDGITCPPSGFVGRYLARNDISGPNRISCLSPG